MIGPFTRNLIDMVRYVEQKAYRERDYEGKVVIVDPYVAAMIRREGAITAISSSVDGKELEVDHCPDGSMYVYVTPFICAVS